MYRTDLLVTDQSRHLSDTSPELQVTTILKRMDALLYASRTLTPGKTKPEIVGLFLADSWR